MSKAIKEKKRPLTAYNFFCQSSDLRESIQKEHSDWSSALILKELGSKWKNLTDDEREPFNLLAIKEKEEFKEYKKANPSLYSNYNYEQVLKRPKSSYMHFSNDVDIREGGGGQTRRACGAARARRSHAGHSRARAGRAPPHAIGRGSSSLTPRQVDGCGFKTPYRRVLVPWRAARARFAP